MEKIKIKNKGLPEVWSISVQWLSQRLWSRTRAAWRIGWAKQAFVYLILKLAYCFFFAPLAYSWSHIAGGILNLIF